MVGAVNQTGRYLMNPGEQKSMHYEFRYLENEKLVEARAAGIWNSMEFPEVVEQFVSVIQMHDCRRVLVDYRGFCIEDRPSEIFTRPTTLLDKGTTRRVVFAVLADAITDVYSFLETVYVNQGFRARVFTDRAEAVKWLTTYDSQLQD